MYEWRNHTAEIELRVRAASDEAVFAEAADAFGRYVELDEGGEQDAGLARRVARLVPIGVVKG